MASIFRENLEMFLENVPELLKPLVPGSIAFQAQKLFSLEYIIKSKKKLEKYSLEFVRGVSSAGDGLTILFSLSSLYGLGKRESAPAELGLLVLTRYALYFGSKYIRYIHEGDNRTDSSN